MKKKSISCIFFFITILFFQCDFGSGDNKGGTSFIDQDLQGYIGGTAWTYQGGNASLTGNSTELWIHIYDTAAAGDQCLNSNSSYNGSVIFIVPNNSGTYELGYSLALTLYNKNENCNYVTTDGTIEIISIDTTGNTVSGRIAATFDDNNTVNGNFTIAYCP